MLLTGLVDPEEADNLLIFIVPAGGWAVASQYD